MASQHTRPGVRKSRSTLKAGLRISTPVKDWESEVLDISLSGMRIERPVGFDLGVGQCVEAELRPERSTPAVLRARVVRVGDGDVALRFDVVSPPLEAELRELIGRFGRLRDDFD
ncbi:MAG: PilZ domain-containing protein [Rehaibacterium terrae]|uniref:PilZ domain-containing protein n=1 Tax=Rehaibacterium terrae TaxID=1341696 RepID=UPI00391C0A54